MPSASIVHGQGRTSFIPVIGRPLSARAIEPEKARWQMMTLLGLDDRGRLHSPLCATSHSCGGTAGSSATPSRSDASSTHDRIHKQERTDRRSRLAADRQLLAHLRQHNGQPADDGRKQPSSA